LKFIGTTYGGGENGAVTAHRMCRPGISGVVVYLLWRDGVLLSALCCVNRPSRSRLESEMAKNVF
jgi:hypothetical protein